jgi:hypothetical protein
MQYGWERDREPVRDGLSRLRARVQRRLADLLRGRYRVLVDDNHRYGHEDERWEAGRFRRYDHAVTRCRRIVEECLQEQAGPGMTADGLYSAYMMFGEDPWVSETPGGTSRFSAWDHARERSLAICAGATADQPQEGAHDAG